MSEETRTRRIAVSSYLAFVATLMLAVIASNQTMANSSVVIGLLATSLPALAVWLYVETLDWKGLEQARDMIRWIVGAVGVALSGVGFLLMLWNFSRVAAFLVVLQMGVWYLLISGVFYLSERGE